MPSRTTWTQRAPTGNLVYMANDSRFDAHEERLQRLESSSEDTRVKVGEIAVKLDFHAEAQERTSADMSKKLDTGFERLAADQERLFAELTSHKTVLEQHGHRLEKMDEHVKAEVTSAVERADRIKKLVIGGALAAAGVFGTKAAEMIWKFFGW